VKDDFFSRWGVDVRLSADAFSPLPFPCVRPVYLPSADTSLPRLEREAATVESAFAVPLSRPKSGRARTTATEEEKEVAAERGFPEDAR